MTPKEIRKKILEVLYEHRSDDIGAAVQDIKDALPAIEDKVLHQEISYLEGKYLAETTGHFMGQAYLNYYAVRITATGVDLVEDPEAFGKLFSINVHQNNFGDISGSNISVNSQYVSQIIDQQDSEVKALLEQLLEATKKKDKSAILKTLSYIGDKSLDLLIAIIAGGVKL